MRHRLSFSVRPPSSTPMMWSISSRQSSVQPSTPQQGYASSTQRRSLADGARERGDVGDLTGVVVAHHRDACIVEHGAGHGDGDRPDPLQLATLPRLGVAAVQRLPIRVQPRVEGLLPRVAGDDRDERICAVGRVRFDLAAGARGLEVLFGLELQRRRDPRRVVGCETRLESPVAVRVGPVVRRALFVQPARLVLVFDSTHRDLAARVAHALERLRPSHRLQQPMLR